jgi:anti-sigma B factor antagonist
MAVDHIAPHERFELQDVVSGGSHRLVLSGEVDIEVAPALEECLRELCTDGTTALVLDLRKVVFMDSSGLRITLLARELCQSHGCEFMLIQGPAQVRSLFEVAGLLAHLPFSG